MERYILVLAAVLMTACGTPAPGMMGQSDASMTPNDTGMPVDAGQSDSPSPTDSPSADVPVTPPEDVPVPPIDVPAPTDTPEDATPPADVPRDVDMIIAGVGRMSMSGPFMCAAEMCGEVTVSFYESGTDPEPRTVDCNPARTRAGLRSLGFPGDGWSDCRGNTCFRTEGSTMHAIVFPMETGACGNCGTLVDIDMTSMVVMPRASGIRQACHQ